jgi:DNA invertase Pin-like site-specific DNA recombinase
MKILAYARVSGDSQASDGRDGLRRQRLACEAVAKANGWTIAQHFVDKGISGTTDLENRPALSALRAVLKRGDVVIVENSSRIARSLLPFVMIMTDLDQLGVRVIGHEGGEMSKSSDPSVEMIRTIIAAVAAYERHVIVNKLASARRRKRENGERCDGRKPYGFHEHEKAGVELILSMHAAGSTLWQIASALKAAGHKPRACAKWPLTTISGVIRAQGRKDSK